MRFFYGSLFICVERIEGMQHFDSELTAIEHGTERAVKVAESERGLTQQPKSLGLILNMSLGQTFSQHNVTAA